MLPNEHGLSSPEVLDRLNKFGPNKLPEKPPPSDVKIFISQLKSPLVYVLIGAGVITFFLGEVADTAIISFAVIVNTILGFIQERKAEKALTALKGLIHPKAHVIRDSRAQDIDVGDIVPGDIVTLSAGDKIPADGKLVTSNRLFVAEAILTGESTPVKKDHKDMVYMGTICTSGKGVFEVESTGEATEIGKIALKIQEPETETPLRRQLTKLSKDLSVIVFILTLIVFVAGLLRGKGLLEIFTTSVALAVSAIPEGLLVGLTVVLAVGMQRILRKKGLVRNLISAETLGGVTTICIDKTGTLTKGEMSVVDTYGEAKELVLQSVVANDLDDPIVIAAMDWATKQRTGQVKEELLRKHTRLDSIPFSSKDRYFASLNKWDGQSNMLLVNGAPEYLLEWSVLSKKEKTDIKKLILEMTASGKRVVGMARKKVGSSKTNLNESDVKSNLKFVGILAMEDPVRIGVKRSLEQTAQAGIKTIVITGDYPQTAIAVMSTLGITVSEESVVTGTDLQKLSDKELAKLISRGDIKLFARTTPDQKLKIVDALKGNGEVVAMMGDGVNDAPALRHADIGIVVGNASDVAKETADLVLLDSNYQTILKAIGEGRGIFDNIRKIILYLISDAFEEIIAVLGTIVLALPLPVSAAQILWINIISDGFPNLALTIDPHQKGIMVRPPRPSSEPLVTRWMKIIIVIVSVIGGLYALALFMFFLHSTGDLVLARSVTFLALGINSLIYVYSIKPLTDPFWQENPLTNKWLNIAVVFGLVFQFLPFLIEPIAAFFEIKFPGFFAVGLVFLEAILMFMTIEVIKWLVRKHLDWFRD